MSEITSVLSFTFSSIPTAPQFFILYTLQKKHIQICVMSSLISNLWFDNRFPEFFEFPEICSICNMKPINIYQLVNYSAEQMCINTQCWFSSIPSNQVWYELRPLSLRGSSCLMTLRAVCWWSWRPSIWQVISYLRFSFSSAHTYLDRKPMSQWFTYYLNNKIFTWDMLIFKVG